MRLLAARGRVDDHVGQHGDAVEVVAAERVGDGREHGRRRAALDGLEAPDEATLATLSASVMVWLRDWVAWGFFAGSGAAG